MRRGGWISAALLAMGLTACAPPPTEAPVPDNGLGPLTGEIAARGDKALVFMVHGDVSRGGAADYMHRNAARVAERFPGVGVVSLLRPGYYDSKGRQSPGSNNNRRDHYTPVNNAALAQTIRNYARTAGVDRIIVVGHSGGAATLGAVIGQNPGLVSGAVLISCPCDIGKWRSMRNARPWARSQSPIDYVSGLDPAIRITLITGAGDKNTTPTLARDYAAAAKAQGINVQTVIVPGAGHGFGKLRGPMMTALQEMLN